MYLNMIIPHESDFGVLIGSVNILARLEKSNAMFHGFITHGQLRCHRYIKSPKKVTQEPIFTANAFYGGLCRCFLYDRSFQKGCRIHRVTVEIVPHPRRKNATPILGSTNPCLDTI